jgi:hypothetical protein
LRRRRARRRRAHAVGQPDRPRSNTAAERQTNPGAVCSTPGSRGQIRSGTV